MGNNIDVNALFDRQLEAWPLARENYRKLEAVKRRSLDFGRFCIDVQLNADRSRSTAASTDTNSIAGRKCFLCGNNRPAEQSSIEYGDYEILVNPYPIFNRHLTIARKEHIPQSISGRLCDMLSLAEDMPGFVIMYNGGGSGASAPDHMHFQAVPKGNLPLERDAGVAKPFFDSGKIKISSIDDYLREVMVINAGSKPEAVATTEKILYILGENGISEDMTNIFAWVSAEDFIIAIFPRFKHRPSQYFASGGGKIIFSPGAVDMAGTVITVRSEDFDILSPELLKDMFGQVTITRGSMEKSMREIHRKL